MTAYTWAAIGVVAAGAAVYAADVLAGDRIRIAITVRRYRRDMERHLAAVARLEDEIAEVRRRLRECSGEGDGP